VAMHPCRQVRGGRGKVATARPRHQMHVRAGPIGRPRVTGQRDLRTAFRYDGALHVPRARTLFSGSGLSWPRGATDGRQGRAQPAYSNR